MNTATSIRSRIKELFSSERAYVRWFWVSALIVLVIDAFWLHPSTRHLSIVQFFEIIFLRHPYSPLEVLQQFVIVWMIWLLWEERKGHTFQHHRFFRVSFLLFLCLVFIEEVSWGQIFHRYQWPDPISPFMGPHIDVHNVMIGWADTSDLIEAMAGTFTCFLLASPFRLPLTPKFSLTKSSFHMLALSFFLSPFSMIREVNEQDIIFENAIFASITMSLLVYAGRLRADEAGKFQKVVLWLLCPLPWVKFFYLMNFGHYPLFPVWP